MSKDLDIATILDMWRETDTQTGVYIHAPFCKEQCEYCTYKGTLFSRDKYKAYYENYLPNILEAYREVLESDKIDTYFFGGGTPSLMSPKIMEDIFKRIPRFIEKPYKLMEFHMCDWTEEKLDIVKKYNFNTVIACVQTFDNPVLRQQGRRRPRDPESIGKFIKYSLSIGLNVMSDVIFFDTGNALEDFKRLDNDIRKLAEYNVSEISVHTVFSTGRLHTELVESSLNRFLTANDNYYLLNDFSSCSDSILKPKAARLYRKGLTPDEVFPQNKYMDDLNTTEPYIEEAAITNTLGIGSYDNFKHTFSTIEDKIEYVEVGDTVNPKWRLMYNIKDYPLKDLINAFMEDLYTKVGDTPDGISFNFKGETGSLAADTVNKDTHRQLITGITYSRSSKSIKEFLTKMQDKMPEWSFYVD